ncbi:MAG: SAM-dependent methyltransferase [Ktedonobacteraceae bacterium]|nr:SAM-dependent methyltransferase [Ktedonobacteraceae bacterium]
MAGPLMLPYKEMLRELRISMSKDFGDFQTPQPLVDEVISCLLRKGKHWRRAFEPTCGQGNFIQGLLKLTPPLDEIQGIEIQDKYIPKLQEISEYQRVTRVKFKQANIFDLDLQLDLKWEGDGPLLVLGNPPWITNAALSTLGSKNLPVKTNFKGLTRFGAMTGESNFDIAEYIWLKLARELIKESPTIALLCKASVARNVLKFAFDTGIPIKEACLWKINSKEKFDTSVDACLFYVDIEPGNYCYQAKVYQDLKAPEPYATIGIVHGQLVSDITTHQNFAFIDGTCQLTWRQGLKHDAAAIFELRYGSSGRLYNKLGEIVSVEREYIYPLLKSSDIGGKAREQSKRAVLVTQRYIGEDTRCLEYEAPLLWKYLISHRETIEARKSSIYNNQPPFAIFGIGDYSFAPYKVAISGMHKRLKFSVTGPINGRPVQFDDTCYFLACESARQAALISSLLNNPLCLNYLQSIIFWDAKRPVTKKVLQRIDLRALLKQVDTQLLLEEANLLLKEIDLSMASHSDEWPEDLESFLKDYSVKSEMINPSVLEETAKIAQISLF